MCSRGLSFHLVCKENEDRSEGEEVREERENCNKLGIHAQPKEGSTSSEKKLLESYHTRRGKRRW